MVRARNCVKYTLSLLFIFITSAYGKQFTVIHTNDLHSYFDKLSDKIGGYAKIKTIIDGLKEAKKIGFPLVMKVVSPQILHKTDVGGVKVGLDNVNDVKKTFTEMYGRLSKKKGVDVKGILLEKMVPKGVELIVGIQND